MVEIQSVSKQYGRIHALQEVSFQVEPGTILGLLGQNGAGKTTLLNILTGYLAPTSGEVRIDGFDPLLNPIAAKERLGYLPEHPPLYDEMSVREYLGFVSELKRVRRNGIAAHIDEIMELTGLTKMRNRLIGQLSKGYRQRTGIAQALCGDPELIILDEPTSGLDPKQIQETREMIASLQKEHTVLLSSHILSEVQQICSHVVILNQGRVCYHAPVHGQAVEKGITLKCTIVGKQHFLISRLKELPHIRNILPQSLISEGVPFLLDFSGTDEPEKELFSLLSRISAPLLHLSRCEDNLEQVFMNAIAEEGV